MPSTNAVQKRIATLREHLSAEAPELAGLVGAYEELDAVLHRMRLLGAEDSLTSRVSWWPVVSVLGMFSAGKSTSINDLLGEPVQRTSKQAQDDRFTVLCYGPTRADLPGTALSSDSRFPFYGMSDEIEKVAPGEGRMVDGYLAMKTVPSEALRGMILVDSPGFDSDDYRAARLRLVDHILDLSDLVLVYCDANRPEPGAMRDTLSLLVSKSQSRADSDKFLYVLNQIDVVARENNLEDVVAAWQRAMATAGLTSGRFYTVYSESARVAIEDETVAARLKAMRDRDMAEIRGRIANLRTHRGYRVASAAKAVGIDIIEAAVPALAAAIGRWRFKAKIATLASYAAAAVGAVAAGAAAGDPLMVLEAAAAAPEIALPAAAAAALALHWKLSGVFARREAARLPEKSGEFDLRLRDAFLAATRLPAAVVRSPRGWGKGTIRKLARIREAVDGRVVKMNDAYAAPSASSAPAVTAAE